jgi:hypothetical protein
MPVTIAYVYTTVWIALCAASVVLVMRRPRDYPFLTRSYARSLLVPWKLVCFAIALGFFLVAAPYSGDWTWDYTDATFMSVLTYLTAPWAVGTLYRSVRARQATGQVYVAACMWLLSASWSYDGYLLIRDGVYPLTWWSNLIASSVLYLSAGLLFSLGMRPGRGVIFDFMADDWLRGAGPAAASLRIAAYALVFIVLVAAMMLPFVWDPLAAWLAG